MKVLIGSILKTKSALIDSQKLKHFLRQHRFFIITFLCFYFAAFISLSNILSYVYNSYKQINVNFEYIKLMGMNFFKDFQNNNISSIDNYFQNITNSIDDIKLETTKYEFIKNIDWFARIYENLVILQQIILKVDDLLNKIFSQLKIILLSTGFQLTEDESVILTSEENSISVVLKNLSDYIELYYSIEEDIDELIRLYKSVDRSAVKLTEIVSPDLDQNFTKIDKLIEIYPILSKNLLDFALYLPELLGSNKQTSYLVILQNETEMRPSGGLFTAFGVITLENGKIVGEIDFKDTWTLEGYVSYTLGIDVGYRNFGAQNHLMMGSNHLRSWSCGSSYTRAQDSGHYHDLYISSMMFADYYDIANKYNPKEYPSYDHIIMVNYTFSENILEFVQPIYVEPWGVISAEVLYDVIKSETDNTEKYGAFGPNRKKIITDIADSIKNKFFDIPLSEIPSIIKLVVNSFLAKDISLSTKNESIQRYFDKYGLTARVPLRVEYDYFHFSEGQNCSLKLNKWVRNNVIHDIYISDNGTISKSVTINWTNEKVFEPSIKHQYDNTLQYSYRAWTRFMFPINSSNLWSNGFEKSGYTLFRPQIYIDTKINKQIIDSAIEFDHRRLKESDPPARHSLSAKWILDESYNYLLNKESYKLLLQKHPGKSWGENHKINIHYVNNIFTTSIVLDQDKILTFKNGTIYIENFNTKLDWITDLINSL